MPRLSNQKIKLVVLQRIFLEETDVNHPITMNQIIAKLSAKGISAERKSIYDDIETLRMLGTDIKTVRSKSTGYYVDKREFELSELKLLTDAVASSRFIPENQSNALMNKLSSLACVYDRPSLNRRVFVSNRSKNSRNDVLKTIDVLHDAMEKDLSVKFKYFSWTALKEKEYRRHGEFYHISPWALVWDDSCYYLIGYDNVINEIRHFRVDKMEKILLSSLSRQGKKEFKLFDINAYADASFGMFGGKPERITLRCSNRLANVMLDRFGKDTALLKDGDGFKIAVNVIPGPVFLGWVLSFGGEVEILSPKAVSEELDRLIDNFR